MNSYGHSEQYRTGMAPFCDQVLKVGMYVFVPTVRVSLENIVENVESLFAVFTIVASSAGFDCFETGRALFC